MFDTVDSTMSRIRTPLRWNVAIVLALFGLWVGWGAAHQHVEDPTCQLCKLLHHSAAELGRPPDAAEPDRASERLATLPSKAPAHLAIPHPNVRAPPLS